MWDLLNESVNLALKAHLSWLTNSYVYNYEATKSTLKETRNSSKLWTLDFGKNDSSTPKNVPQNTNENTCDYLRYASILICLRWKLFDFKGWLENWCSWKFDKNYRKTLVMESL